MTVEFWGVWFIGLLLGQIIIIIFFYTLLAKQLLDCIITSVAAPMEYILK